MKKLILSATVAFTVLTTSNIYAQQGFGTNTPDRSSAVDIVSSKRGLLIPRIDIPNLDQAAPVSNPANALMVYNTGKTTAAGFYYWDASYNNGAGRWVRFVSSNSGSAVTVSAGTNVMVTPTSDGRDTDYNVSVKGGTAPNQVLVTKLGDNNTYVSEWVNPEEFLKDVVTGTNGVKTEIIKDDKGNVVNTVVKLGGDLTEQTVLNTGKGKELAITGLETLVGKDAATGTKFNSSDDKVVVMGADGILKNVSAKDLVEDAIDKGTINGKALTSKSITVDSNAATSLLKDVNIEITPGDEAGKVLVTKDENGTKKTEWVTPESLGNTVTASNGLTKDANNDIALGGALAKPTTITTDPTNTLAIDGLTTVEKKDLTGNNIVIADANGVLKETSAKNLIEDAIDKGGVTAKPLTTDGKIVIGTNKDSKLDNAVLVETHLSIKAGSIGTTELTDGAVTAEKMTANVGAADAPKGSIPVAGENGSVTYQQVTGDLLNGKALTSPTGSISVSGSGAKALLDATTIDIKGGTVDGQVLVTEKVGDDFVTKWVTPTDLGNTVTASNGLTKTGNDITLGGAIDTPTTLAIDNTKGSLSITGLGTAAKDKTNKTVVVQADGKLATVDTAAGNVTINQEGDVNISDNSVVNNYHPSMSEIVIEVTLGDADTNLSLPAVNGTEGQTISVKIVNTKETHKGYLVIKDDKKAFLSEGAMPYQGWIIKSNGTKWIVVGRN
ncbi:hypothetical protein AV926_04100 [Myroides marinus]|uniref:Uncharacterized protein n=1 Tax=Myroides marinus TaxID=703342 RepID=A0A164AEE3_9FLAO|nr:hypothetical protein [Myroides marinus]KZE83703.1 hypothetical protein AV926_04100 [Myroides marinus]